MFTGGFELDLEGSRDFAKRPLRAAGEELKDLDTSMVRKTFDDALQLLGLCGCFADHTSREDRSLRIFHGSNEAGSERFLDGLSSDILKNVRISQFKIRRALLAQLAPSDAEVLGEVPGVVWSNLSVILAASLQVALQCRGMRWKGDAMTKKLR